MQVQLHCEHTIPSDFDGFTKLASLAFDFDAVVEELLEVSTIEDTVASGLRVVDDKLVLGGDFSGGGFGLYARQKKGDRCEPTEKITQQSSAGTDHLEGGGSLEAFGDVDDGVWTTFLIARSTFGGLYSRSGFKV